MAHREARAAAERLLNEFGVTEPPVKLTHMVAGCGLKLVRAPLGSDVSGMLVTPPHGTPAIVVNRADHRHRQRFTIAHELGHHVLRHQFQPGSHVHVDRGNFVSYRGPVASTGMDPMEVDANQFAAALLMPKALVIKAVIDMSVSGLTERHVQQLAQLFAVSEAAMSFRLSALGFDQR